MDIPAPAELHQLHTRELLLSVRADPNAEDNNGLWPGGLSSLTFGSSRAESSSMKLGISCVGPCVLATGRAAAMRQEGERRWSKIDKSIKVARYPDNAYFVGGLIGLRSLRRDLLVQSWVRVGVASLFWPAVDHH